MKSKTIWWIVIIVVVVGLVAWGISAVKKSSSKPGALDDFAKCIASSGAKFYGAFWCPHCQNQKKEFGSSAQYLPYVECSTPDGQSQLAACTDKGVSGYPTWIFADGSKLEGEIPLATLAQKTSCTLPAGY